MNITQKITLARMAVPKCGLRPTLEAVGLSRATWYYYQRRRRTYAEKYRDLCRPLAAISHAHPECGYRRVTVELRATWGHDINYKVIQRLQPAAMTARSGPSTTGSRQNWHCALPLRN
jgi:hypothetical protein